MKQIQLANKRERWGLTVYGKALVFLVVVLLVIGFVGNIVPFLSAEKTIDAKILIIEGYVPDYAYPGIIELFQQKNYELIVTSGTSFDQGHYIAGVKTAADLIRNSLINLGFDSSKVIAVPVPPEIYKDRTWHSALYSFNYIKANYPETKKANIVSTGVHSRRSKYLFDMVFEPEIELGNIVIDQPSVPKRGWYKSSRGFKTVLNESISYLYVKLFFWPEQNNEPTEPKS